MFSLFRIWFTDELKFISFFKSLTKPSGVQMSVILQFAFLVILNDWILSENGPTRGPWNRSTGYYAVQVDHFATWSYFFVSQSIERLSCQDYHVWRVHSVVCET